MRERSPVDSSVFLMDLLLPLESIEAALQLLTSASAETRVLRGCRSCRVAVDAVQRDRVCYREEWDSETALERRIRSDEFRRVLIAADLSADEPRILLGKLHGVGGMEQLAEVRAGISIADLLPPAESLPRAPAAGA